MATMNVSLPKKMKDWVEKRASEGSFANSSDYIRELIRRDTERQEAIARLQRIADEARASPPVDEPLDKIVAKARAKAIAALKAKDAA